jgi:hypothetical protein
MKIGRPSGLMLGLSWQITPRILTETLVAGGGEAKRAFATMLPMKKIDIVAIEAAARLTWSRPVRFRLQLAFR